MTISNNPSRTALAPLPSQPDAPVTQVNTQVMRDDTPPAANDQAPRVSGDSALAQNYGNALSGFTGVPANDTAIMVDVPANSTFGQWWKQLADAAKSPEFIAWQRDNSATGTIEILPSTGQIRFQKTAPDTGSVSWELAGDEDSTWCAVRGPIMEAGRVVYTNASFRPPTPTTINRAPAWLVGHFYFEKALLSPSAFQQRATELERDKTFSTLDPVTFARVHELRSEDALSRQKTRLGNTHDRHEAAKWLKHLGEGLKSGARETSTISQYLDETPIQAHPDSSYTQDWASADTGLNMLKDLLEFLGINIPGTAEEVENLRLFLLTPTPQRPVNGNYGGAMS